MTRAATGHRFGAFDRILLRKLRSFDFLIPLLIPVWILVVAVLPHRGRPVHRKHFFPGPDELLGIAVTSQTPFHVQRSYLIRERHLVHAAVTRRAAHTFVDVDAVVEIGEVRKIVHASPSNRFARAPALADRFQIRTVSPDLCVTTHTGPSRGDSRKSALLNRSVAIAAIDAVVADMMFVAELNRLLARKKSLCVVRRPVEFQQEPHDDSNKKHSAVNRELGDVVGAASEDLAHSLSGSEAVQKKRQIARQQNAQPAAIRMKHSDISKS